MDKKTSKKAVNIYQSIPEKTKEYFQFPLISDNGFREYDVRWLIGKELNYQGITILGKAFGTQMLKDYDISEVVVGFDYRKYSQNVKNAFVVGLLSTGITVRDIGLALSPMTYFAQYELEVRACAMITASHNENGWTGIKLGYDLSRTLGPDEIKRFKEIVHSGDYWEGRGSYQVVEGMIEKYIDDVVGSVHIQKKLKIVVATGNGTAGMIAPAVMRKAGFEVVELKTDLDWDFPNFNPNPEDIKFLESIGKCVREEKADIGIGIDGDGDRLGVVDENGEEVFSDKVGLIIARDLIQQYPDSTFVVDVKTTGQFLTDEILQANNASTIYWKTGHSYIKSKVQETEALAGFERSGHMFLNTPVGPGYRGYDDACLAAVKFCEILSKNNKHVSEILATLPHSFQSPTMSPHCDDLKKYKVVEGILNSYIDDRDQGNSVAGLNIKELIDVNGVRVVFDDGSWGLVRASSNTPGLVIVAESFGSKKQLYNIVDDIMARLSKYPEVGEFDQTLPDYDGEE